MVRIIKGSYGRREGNNITAIKAGETVELTKEQEARLVKLGVAEYVDKKAESAKQDAPDPNAGKGGKNNVGAGTGGDDSDNEDASGELPEYNENMKLVELQEIAVAYGVDASASRSKKEVIALIEAARSELPNIGKGDTVVDGE